jgi:hypothetical protein
LNSVTFSLVRPAKVIDVVVAKFEYVFHQEGRLMKNTISGFIAAFIAPALALLLTACGGGGGSGSGGTGTLSLNITDAPVQNEDIAEVIVCFTDVIIHPANGDPNIEEDVRNDDGTCREINLKELTNGNSVVLGEFDIPAGDYSWIRLVIDPAYTVIVERTVNGDPDELETPSDPADTLYDPALLDCSSCDQSHLKLNRSFSVENAGFIAFTIDFDLQKSLTLQLPQSEKRRPDYAYKLRPTLRILDTELASTFIWGSVTDEFAAGGDPRDCKVYTYSGAVAAVTPDDECIEIDGCSVGFTPGDRPINTVDVDGTDGGPFVYRTGSLYPGTYTVALFCVEDDLDVDEALDYIGVQEVDATLDPPSPSGTGPVDFDLSDPGSTTPL